MAEVIWTKIPVEDLAAIHEYIAKDSSKYAERLANKIVDRVEILYLNPKAGKVVPEFDNDHIRELIEGNYRIIYRIIKENKVRIVNIKPYSSNSSISLQAQKKQPGKPNLQASVLQILPA